MSAATARESNHRLAFLKHKSPPIEYTRIKIKIKNKVNKNTDSVSGTQ